MLWSGDSTANEINLRKTVICLMNLPRGVLGNNWQIPIFFTHDSSALSPWTDLCSHRSMCIVLFNVLSEAEILSSRCSLGIYELGAHDALLCSHIWARWSLTRLGGWSWAWVLHFPGHYAMAQFLQNWKNCTTALRGGQSRVHTVILSLYK